MANDFNHPQDNGLPVGADIQAVIEVDPAQEAAELEEDEQEEEKEEEEQKQEEEEREDEERREEEEHEHAGHMMAMRRALSRRVQALAARSE